MKKSLTFVMLLFVVVMASGCNDTWKGAKKDTKENAEFTKDKAKDGVEWSKDKVNDGAKYIEKKTD